MADWNGDGNMDILLLAKVLERRGIAQQSQCTLYLYEQHKIGGKTTLVFKDEPLFRNEGCSSFDGSGASFADVDGDGDLDAIFGSYNGPLHVYNRTSEGLVKPNKFPSTAIPLEMIQLENLYDYYGLEFKANVLHPVLADWDLDGDLDLALLHPLGYKHPKKNRYFLHLPDDTVTELNGPPNSSCPIDWGRHFSVADFDGDGKKDLVGFGELVGLGYLVVVCLQTSSGFVVVEPEKIPFNYPPRCPQCLSNLSYYWVDGLLGFPSFLDWDGDGDMDVYFYEQLSNGTVFAHPLPLPSAHDFSAADFDGDGDVDIMIVPLNSDSCLYFERLGDGSLEQLFGTDNPFNDVCRRMHGDDSPSNDLYASLGDWDGDGEKDLVVIDNFKLTLWTNRPMETYVEVNEKDNPFGQIRLRTASEVSLVDANDDGRDGDLDLVQAYYPGGTTVQEAVAYSRWATTIILEMLHNGTSKAEREAWAQRNGYRQMRFYRNVGGSFQELVGSANPFRDVALGMDVFSACPTFVDLDKDDVLELVLGTTEGNLPLTSRKLQYFKQQNGTFQRIEETPFADFLIKDTFDKGVGIIPRFVDWDGNGNMDLVITGTDKVHFFQRGVCKPSVSYCKSGVCNQQTSNCSCDAGAEGQDCSLCGNYYVREKDQCRPCPGHNELAGTCSRRGEGRVEEGTRSNFVISVMIE
eukprot:s3464_g5.t1